MHKERVGKQNGVNQIQKTSPSPPLCCSVTDVFCKTEKLLFLSSATVAVDDASLNAVCVFLSEERSVDGG